MAQVTYRGVQYDTETRLQQQQQQQLLNKNNLFTEVLKLKEASDVGNCRNSRGSVAFLALIYVELQTLVQL